MARLVSLFIGVLVSMTYVTSAEAHSIEFGGSPTFQVNEALCSGTGPENSPTGGTVLGQPDGACPVNSLVPDVRLKIGRQVWVESVHTTDAPRSPGQVDRDPPGPPPRVHLQS